MKVLSISRDKDAKIFEENSYVSLRSISYGQKMEELNIVVFTLKSQGLSVKKLSENVTVYPTNSSSKWFFVSDSFSIGKKIILDRKFIRGKDVITAQDPFECGFIAWRISKKFRLPFEIQIHTDFLSPYFKTSFLQTARVFIAKFLLPKASGIRVVSKRIFDSIKNNNLKLKVEPKVLPIRIDLEALTESQDKTSEDSDLKKIFPEAKFIILMASRLTKEKRIPDALSVFSKVLKKYPSSVLCIVGDGPLKNQLRALSDKLKISDKVSFLGWRNDIPSLMKSANLFFSASEYEGYGMTLIEAGLSACPVLTTNVGISDQILKHNQNSYICNVGDTICMYEGVVKFIEDNSFRYEISQRLKEDLKDSIPLKEDYVNSLVHLLEEASKRI